MTAKRGTAEPTSGPTFSPESVYELAKAAREVERSPTRSKPLPEKGAEVYWLLALILTRLKHLFDNGRPGVALELDRKRWEIARAIWTLKELLPATRPDYESEVEVATMEKWRDVADPDYANSARANLAAFDELVRAAGAARQLGLPIIGIDRLAPDVTRPTDLIKQLELSLSTSSLHLSAAERHRLVAEVARLIVGDGLKGLDQAKVRDRIRK